MERLLDDTYPGIGHTVEHIDRASAHISEAIEDLRTTRRWTSASDPLGLLITDAIHQLVEERIRLRLGTDR
jgi:hypothetical protein